VPQQISVIGFDDSPLAGLAHIQLTTIRQDSAGLASAAMERLVSRLDGDETDKAAVDIVREPTLVVRASTGVPSP
jgi:DNA-binding LacI/PurR family transcriptional regulator